MPDRRCCCRATRSTQLRSGSSPSCRQSLSRSQSAIATVPSRIRRPRPHPHPRFRCCFRLSSPGRPAGPSRGCPSRCSAPLRRPWQLPIFARASPPSRSVSSSRPRTVGRRSRLASPPRHEIPPPNPACHPCPECAQPGSSSGRRGAAAQLRSSTEIRSLRRRASCRVLAQRSRPGPTANPDFQSRR